ncbi:hypothetical protein XENTR_v10004031 [Xenopus tropicalis]|nr:hypothetical protein XENTR_v10004031 [Xenopus tropicalis]
MVSCIEAMPFAQFHLRTLQWNILSVWHRNRSLSQQTLLSPLTRTSLRWWLNTTNLTRGRSLADPAWRILTTDASLSGWGAVLEGQLAQGSWSRTESLLPINILELRAIRLALIHWQTLLHGQSIRIQTDNATAVAYISHQGGTRSHQAFTEASRILRWAELHHTLLSAIYIPGVENWEADYLSRQTMDPGEWSLKTIVFLALTLRWGTPEVDVMASRTNHKVPRYLARTRDPRAESIDAMTTPWSFTLAYIFPPLPMLPRVIKKIKREKVRTILIPPLLAAPDLVLRPSVPVSGRTMASASGSGPPLPGSLPPPKPNISTFDGMATESLILRRKGFSEPVIKTLLAARKPVSAQAYHRVWRTYRDWCSKEHVPFLVLSIPTILHFLQAGLDKGLSLGSLKAQVSALSALFQERLALLPDIRTFMQGVTHIRPPFRHPCAPWDLNLVLKALQEPPFVPLASIPIIWLTRKLAFLLAISSARRISELSALSCKSPFLIFHLDMAVLRTVLSFLPKVVTKFHINQELTIPSFCPNPKSPKEVALHSLDAVRALKYYVHRTEEIRKSDALLVIPTGTRLGQPASKTTISRWLRETIRRAYISRGKQAPRLIRAHSTRSVSTSWVFRNQASAEQLCKAATWSSIHSFVKFYKFDAFAASDAHFGRKVLQAAVV